MNEYAKAITRLDNGWLQVKVPLPFSLKWVNAYLLPEREGWTLVDPGLRTEEIEAFWISVMQEMSIDWKDIKSIVLTHHHPDHYGMAGWFQERSGAPVRMSQAAQDCADRLWGENETFSDELTEAFLLHGMDERLTEAMREHMRGFRAKVNPQPPDPLIIRQGERISMNGTEWEIIGGEGHAPGHLSFYDRQSGKLLCGDQVLPDISPNIGWMPGGDSDPLGAFLASLLEMLPLEVSMVYPGHRDPFPEYRRRIEELLDHHERRLQKMEEILSDGGKSAFEVCELLFGTRLRSNTHNLRFALAETIAHLIQMEKRGTAVRVESDRTIRYRLAETK
jgi:glyoxylase-like metal-dependent hydrolase (beta-lactamase superfamily II)